MYELRGVGNTTNRIPRSTLSAGSCILLPLALICGASPTIRKATQEVGLVQYRMSCVCRPLFCRQFPLLYACWICDRFLSCRKTTCDCCISHNRLQPTHHSARYPQITRVKSKTDNFAIPTSTARPSSNHLSIAYFQHCPAFRHAKSSNSELVQIAYSSSTLTGLYHRSVHCTPILRTCCTYSIIQTTPSPWPE